jgi:hypothetical protein
MYVVSFHPIFNENAIILANRLKVPFVTEFSPQEGDIVIVFGSHEQADKLYFIQELKHIHYILIQTEQFPSKVFDNKYYMELVQKNALLDWSRYNVERIKSKLSTKVYSFYFFDFMVPDQPEWEDRPIDFFFCGAGNETRKKWLDEFQKDNPTAHIEIDFNYTYINPVVLVEKLKKVKYVLNLPFYEDNCLETHRIHRALSAGCEVVSLYSKDTHMNKQYEPYVHFVKDLHDFTLLLEQERKGNFAELMNDFGLKAVEGNLRAIRHAEQMYKTPPKPKAVEKTPTDFMSLLQQKKLKATSQP